MEHRLPHVLFSNLFPKERSNHESQKSGSDDLTRRGDFMDGFSVFRFQERNFKSDLGFKNPDLDFPQKTQYIIHQDRENRSRLTYYKALSG